MAPKDTDDMKKDREAYFRKYLDLLAREHLYPSIHTIDGPSSEPTITIGGRSYITFSSNNYLGLAQNEKLKDAVRAAITPYGIGSGSTRLLSGTLDVQVELERNLAAFHGYEESITFSSGYLANVGVIRMLVDPFPYFHPFYERPGVIISDEYNHACIIDGARLSRAKRMVYRHSAMADLERSLKRCRGKRALVVTDSVFSMDGDLANLPDIVGLVERYDALLMIDDSHGVGVIGPHGEGTAAHFGLSNRVNILMGSFTKAYGSIGGFIATSKTIADYLRITARSYIFSDPILPAVVTGLNAAIDVIREGDDRRLTLKKHGAYLREHLRAAGFTVLGELTPIIPILVAGEATAIKFASILFDEGILAPCIRRPAVQEGKERIRLSLNAHHTKEHIDRLIAACKIGGQATGVI